MLLRLLPVPSPSQPSPPTILFTLPLPTHPYTARSLPLPPNLLAHRSLCLQEDIECSNVLLGDKASWIGGIVDDVTFSLPHQKIIVHLVDSTAIELPLTDACMSQLHRVVDEVQLSFQAAAAPPPSPVDNPRLSTSSIASDVSTSSASSSVPSSSSLPQITIPSRRSPSSLLYSLLSPLLPNSPTARPSPPPHVAAHQQPARAHRRQARSLLVDAYRRHVLPEIKESLPTAYLPWAVTSESAHKMEEFAKLREEISDVLTAAGVETPDLDALSRMPTLKRCRSSSSTRQSDEESQAGSPITPATSIFSDRFASTSGHGISSPQSFLLAIPPAHALPAKHRHVYSAQLTRLTQIASRLGSITKLRSRYDREESKRQWLEGLELGRAADKSYRRAFSNGQFASSSSVNATPVRRSGLFQSITAADLQRAEAAIAIHPAMMEDVAEETECSSLSDVESEPDLSDGRSSSSASPEPIPRTPTQDRDNLDFVNSCDQEDDGPIPSVVHIYSRQLVYVEGNDELAPPTLVPSLSDDSLSDRDEWDSDSDHELDSRGKRPPLVTLWPAKSMVDHAHESHSWHASHPLEGF